MLGQTNTFTRSVARPLRKNMTDAERVLWHRLRGGQLGAKFRRQHPFREYILDFVCIEHRLVVEVDGSQHADNVLHDLTRTACLQAAGFKVLRFWNNEVIQQIDSVVEAVMSALTPSPPQPSP